MAINLELDPHDIKWKFLYQYKESIRFQKYVESFIQPAFSDMEAQFFAMISDRALDNATGQNLRMWAEFFGVPYTGQDDETLRDAIYWKAAENFGTGSIYEVRAFFEKWYRAQRVEVTELPNGEIDLRIIDGTIKNDGSIVDWPCFPPGMAQIKNKTYTPAGNIFSFVEDNDPDGAGYGIVTRVAEGATTPPIYTYPDASVTGQVIWVDYNMSIDVLDVTLRFKVELAKGTDMLNALKAYFTTQPSDEIAGGLVAFVDRNGTEWEFVCKQAFSAQPTLVTKVDDVATSTISVKCVVDNVSWIDLRVNGVSRPYGTLNGTTGIPAFSAYNGSTGDSTIFAQKNPNGLTVKYNITEKSGVGGRFSLKL